MLERDVADNEIGLPRRQFTRYQANSLPRALDEVEGQLLV
jgi:hypothetical protein